MRDGWLMTAAVCLLPWGAMAADVAQADAQHAMKHAQKPPKHSPKEVHVAANHAPVKKPVYVYKYAGDAPAQANPKDSVPATLAQPLAAQAERLAAVAQVVHTGHMVCELGNSVVVTPDEQSPGHFWLKTKQHTYHMAPVVSATGAVRLEDPHAGAMWLQLANKSMLMNSKLGQRMADDCQSPEQAEVAQAMKLNPPPHLLDGPTVANK